MKRNKFVQRSNKGQSHGLFHDIDEMIRDCIVGIAIKDAPKTQQRHTEELEKQATARRIKEEIIKEKSFEKSMEENIDAQYYHRMGDSLACWKGDPKVATKNLKKLNSESAKYKALKENILIRVKGYGWEWCKHAWSINGRKYKVSELAKHLQTIIKKEKGIPIPLEPPINLPQRMDLPAH